MKAIFLANIGNSDVGKNGQALFGLRESKNNVYEETKKIYENKQFDGYDAIILEPIISEIKKDSEIERIYLFATKQDPIHPQDTEYAGKIVQEILKKKFGYNDKIFREKIINRNPADYDSMFKYYQDEINEITIDDNISTVFISITGGTPAQNMSLLLSAVAKFGMKAQAVYKFGMKAQAVYLPRGSNIVKKEKIGEMIYKKFLEERVEELIKKHLYGAAADLSEKFGLKNLTEIKELRAKEKRDLFDFDGATSILNDIKDMVGGETRTNYLKDIERLENLKKGDEKALIKELYENMKRRWEQGAYTDFLGRLFRFEEAVYYYLIHKKFGIDISTKNNHKKFIEKIKSDEKLYKNLKSKKYGGKELNIDEHSVDRPLLFFVISFYKRDFGLIERIFKQINDYEGQPDKSLGELRNKSILAHGFEGISKEKIREKYKSDKLMEDVEEIVKFIDKFEG